MQKAAKGHTTTFTSTYTHIQNCRRHPYKNTSPLSYPHITVHSLTPLYCHLYLDLIYFHTFNKNVGIFFGKQIELQSTRYKQCLMPNYIKSHTDETLTWLCWCFIGAPLFWEACLIVISVYFWIFNISMDNNNIFWPRWITCFLWGIAIFGNC